MAKITPSPLVSKISGKIGNMIFSSWKGTQYAKLLPISIHNPGTSDQAKFRNNLVSLLGGWKLLTAGQKDLWQEYAQFLGSASASTSQVGTRSLIKPVGTVMTGLNAYIMVNQRLFSVGLEKVIIPPIDPIPGPTEVEIANTPGTELVATATFPANSLTTGDKARMFLRNNRSGGHSYLERSVAVTVTPDVPIVATFDDVIFLKVGHEGSISLVAWENVEGFPISIQFDAISQQGYKSPASTVLDFTVKGPFT